MIKQLTTYTAAILLVGLLFVGCEDYDLPVDIDATADEQTYVEFGSTANVSGTAGEVTNVNVFVRPTSIQQDVEVGFTVNEPSPNNEAVEGVDYEVVANPFTIVHQDPDDEANLDSDPIEINILPDATSGRVIRLELSSAVSAQGEELRIGRRDDLRTVRRIVID